MRIKRSKFFIPFLKKETQGTTGRIQKGAFVQQHASGIYTWLFLGQRMLEKISAIIDDELKKIHAMKILMPTLHDANLWKQSNRYEEFGNEMLKIKDRHKREYIYGPSAEELVTHLLTQWPIKKSSLPLILYNTQWKFRDEIRPRFGIARSREFLMNDAYSFHNTKACLMRTYELMFAVYSRIFYRLKISVATAQADTGLMGGFLSHEWLCESESGETSLKYKTWPDQPLRWEHKDDAKIMPAKDKFAEIGHIYALGDKYTQTFKIKNRETMEPLMMGCYGIGVSRLASVIMEKDNMGAAAPFARTLITLTHTTKCMEIASKIYNLFEDIVWDDRQETYGVKCAEADLIGSPLQIHMGEMDVVKNQVVVKKQSNIKKIITLEQLFNQYDKDAIILPKREAPFDEKYDELEE